MSAGIAMAVIAGVQALDSILNKPKKQIRPADSKVLGEDQQGIASIELDTIGDETLNEADDIKFKELEKPEDIEITETLNTPEEGLASLLKQLPIQQAAEGEEINSEGVSASETEEYINMAFSILQLLLDKDEKPPIAPARAPSFSVESQGIGPLQTIGMNTGGEPSKVLARPMFNGDPVVGPGGPKDDIIPVLASDGEFMLSKAAVDHAGGGNHALGIERLKAFNNKGNQKYG
tara:strand:- start:361 stop:1062 length:702 start_codon:yes stop_codon:yes gene_type:complete